MKLFLRTVLLQIPSAVIGGGFPAATYAESKNYASWRPQDVDIFVFDEEQVAKIKELFHVIVVHPLGWGSPVTRHLLFYDTPKNQQNYQVVSQWIMRTGRGYPFDRYPPYAGYSDIHASIPIKIIQVEVTRGDILLHNARMICEGFDISLCCMALTEITDDLSFSGLEEFNDAFSALHSRTLKLTEYACSDHSRPYQKCLEESRIAKYIKRCFRR